MFLFVLERIFIHNMQVYGITYPMIRPFTKKGKYIVGSISNPYTTSTPEMTIRFHTLEQNQSIN
jgi:hypothetical protein